MKPAMPSPEVVALEIFVALLARGEHRQMGVDRAAAILAAITLWDHAELPPREHPLAAAVRELASEAASDHPDEARIAEAGAVVGTVLHHRIARSPLAGHLPERVWPSGSLDRQLDLVVARTLAAVWPDRNRVRIHFVHRGVIEIAANNRKPYDRVVAALREAGLRVRHRVHTSWTTAMYVAEVRRSELLCRWRAVPCIESPRWTVIVDGLFDGGWSMVHPGRGDGFDDEDEARQEARERHALPEGLAAGQSESGSPRFTDGIRCRPIDDDAVEHEPDPIAQALRGMA